MNLKDIIDYHFGDFTCIYLPEKEFLRLMKLYLSDAIEFFKQKGAQNHGQDR